jgi:UDP-N-acetylglucosamine--N-acetylmuramyl-(pentapeptide) pyrophosphoryl-undecaprenol N-acetylglucosamine transferase
MSEKTHVIIAAGGTGGHLFPAQALARELKEKYEGLSILFVGGDLSANRCFHKDNFAFHEICVATPYRTRLFSACLKILEGCRQSWKILSKVKPKVVIGFGSYHAFPMLLAALIRRVPFIIFESDAIPGKVNRLFARWSKFNAVQFEGAAPLLKGTSIQVNVPLWEKPGENKLTREEACAYFGLSSTVLTLLVFGGSQGAKSINRLFCEAIGLFPEAERQFQVIHLTGKMTDAEPLRREYARLGMTACVKEFEDRMHLAWRAAQLCVCRAGAATLAEQTAFEVPGILIPYPYATGDHQQKNARFMEKEVGGAVCLNESTLNASILHTQLCTFLAKDQLARMQANIRDFKHRSQKKDLSTLIYPLLDLLHN